MPGEKELLAEVCAGLQPPLLRQLVHMVFAWMRQADVIGSLLRIEDDLAEALAQARRQLARGQKYVQEAAPLPGVRHPEAMRFLLAGIEDDDQTFWAEAENQVLHALQAYAERAENGRGASPGASSPTTPPAGLVSSTCVGSGMTWSS